MLSSTDVFEQVVLKLADVFVFKIPPLRSASGHRADDWDLEKPLFTGFLKVYQADQKLFVRIYQILNGYSRTPSDENLQFFAECHIEIKPNETVTNFIDSVIDSSRYFALKIKDRKTSKTALIGIGWQDRDPAFEFKNCLNEYIRYVSRMAAASSTGDAIIGDDFNGHEGQQYSNKGDDEEAEDFIIRDDTSKVATVRPSISLSLPVGQKIKIKALGSKQFEKSKLSSDTNSSIINNHDIPNPNTGPSSADKSIVVGEDEWGDFESAS